MTMDALTINNNFNEYINRLRTYLSNKDGIENLIDYIVNKTDLKDAPYTKDTVLAERGGAIKFALSLHDTMINMTSSFPWSSMLDGGITIDGRSYKITQENMAIVSLLSILDNVYLFTTESKNRKCYDPEKIQESINKGERPTIKNDSKGQFMWEAYDAYTYDDILPLGPGVKAISLITAYININCDEMLAIRWNSASPSSPQTYATLNATYEKSPLAVMVGTASTTAKYVVENEKIMFNNKKTKTNEQVVENKKPKNINNINNIANNTNKTKEDVNKDIFDTLNDESMPF